METFISYEFEQDRNKYDDICYAFDGAGIKYWSTSAIAAGQRLPDELQKAIRRCSVCVFIATLNSRESGWCQAEIGAFWGLGRPVIVWLADNRLTEGDLPKQFVGEKFARTIKEVVAAVNVHLSESTGISQTEAIFCLAIEAFLGKLRLQFEPIRYFDVGHPAPGSWKGGPNLRWTNAYGQHVSYDTTKPRLEAESDLRALIKRVATLRQRREREVMKTLLSLFTTVQGQAQYISHHLGRISYGNTTLSEPWQRAQESLLQLWEEKSKELAYFPPDELDRLREFLEGHPAYQQVYAEEKTNIESFLHTGALRIDELIEMTESRLTRSMKELLVEK